MSKTITLPISENSKLLVSIGDHISGRTLMAKIHGSENLEIIHISKLLGVPNHQIIKYLQKKVGENIFSGDIIAQKKGIISSSAVRSPIAGKLVEMDLSKGTISLSRNSHVNHTNQEFPVSGKVVAISKSFIEIEVENTIYVLEKGEGEDVIGLLKFLPGDVIGVTDNYGEVDKTIILCKYTQEAALVKFSVLGVRGVVMLKLKDGKELPSGQVSDTVFNKLQSLDSRKIWLRPVARQLIILD